MNTQLKLALKDIRKNKVRIVALFLQVLLIAFLFAILIEHSAMNDDLEKASDNISDYEIISFRSVWYSSYVKFDENINSFFKELFDSEDSAYSFIENARLQGFPDLNLVIGIGQFAKMFGIDEYKMDLDSKDNYIFIGAELNDLEIGEEVKFGSYKTHVGRVDGRLNKGAFYSRQTNYINLDNSVVILMSFEDFAKKFMAHDFFILLNNLYLIAPNVEEIDNIVRVANSIGKITLIPNSTSLQNEFDEVYKSGFISIMFFTQFMISAIIFSVVGLFSSLHIMINRNIGEYIIHKIYGATQKDLNFRMGFFLLGALLLSGLLVGLFMSLPFMKYLFQVDTIQRLTLIVDYRINTGNII